MSDWETIAHVALKPHHIPTGGTRHYRGSVELPPPTMLKITKSAEDGYYLIHCDARGEEQTDTYHESMADAIAQAEWEYGIKPDEWTFES